MASRLDCAKESEAATNLHVRISKINQSQETFSVHHPLGMKTLGGRDTSEALWLSVPDSETPIMWEVNGIGYYCDEKPRGDGLPLQVLIAAKTEDASNGYTMGFGTVWIDGLQKFLKDCGYFEPGRLDLPACPQYFPCRWGSTEDPMNVKNLTLATVSLLSEEGPLGDMFRAAVAPIKDGTSEVIKAIFQWTCGESVSPREELRPALSVLLEHIAPGWRELKTRRDAKIAACVTGLPHLTHGNSHTQTQVYLLPSPIANKVTEMMADGWPPLVPHWLSRRGCTWNGPLNDRCQSINRVTVKRRTRTETMLFDRYEGPGVRRNQAIILAGACSTFQCDIAAPLSPYFSPLPEWWIDNYCRAIDGLLAMKGDAVATRNMRTRQTYVMEAARTVPIILTDSRKAQTFWECHLDRSEGSSMFVTIERRTRTGRKCTTHPQEKVGVTVP